MKCRRKPGLVVLFGSGEMSPAGRRIHDYVLRKSGFTTRVNFAILETPTGFEVNARHSWPERMANFFSTSLTNFHPQIDRIPARRRQGENSTQNPHLAARIINADYVYAGAGSPTYAYKMLENSLLLSRIEEAVRQGAVLCFGSATAIAMGNSTLPVYEIFKAGFDLYWEQGLHFFKKFGFDPVIIPHWDNREGEDFDTTRAWMGEARFAELLKLLPVNQPVLGIDEQTALVINLTEGTVEVMGIGGAHIVKSGKTIDIPAGKNFSLDIVRTD